MDIPMPHSKKFSEPSRASASGLREIVIAPKIAGVYLLSFTGRTFDYYIGESADVWMRLHTHNRFLGPLRGVILTTTGFENDSQRRQIEKKFIAAAWHLSWKLLNGNSTIRNAANSWYTPESVRAEMTLL